VSAPKVSIGMPVYNGERYVAEAIESLLAQTFRDFELIVSDNASHDGTEAICRAIAAKDARVRYVRQSENRGAAWNYNFVVGEARGRYFKWAAADDVCLPTYLERCLEVLEASPDVILCYAQTTIIDEHGTQLRPYDDQLHLVSPDPVERKRALSALIGECNAVFGLIRIEVLRRTAMIASYSGADVGLLTELSLYGKFVQVPERLFLRRDHADASSADKSIEGQMTFYDPGHRGRVFFPLSRRTLEFWRAIWRAPLTAEQKVLLSADTMLHSIRSRDLYWAELKRGARRAWRRARRVDSLPAHGKTQ
jgi:glycosyltransferase involved in cell wall biosynthesis